MPLWFIRKIIIMDKVNEDLYISGIDAIDDFENEICQGVVYIANQSRGYTGQYKLENFMNVQFMLKGNKGMGTTSSKILYMIKNDLEEENKKEKIKYMFIIRLLIKLMIKICKKNRL